MKKLLALLLMFVLVFTLFGCDGGNDNSDNDNERSTSYKIAAEALEEVKDCWSNYYEENHIDNGRIEVVNTRIIYIKDDIQDETLKKYFDNVDCVVDFALYVNHYNTDKYYVLDNSYSAVVYNDGSIEVEWSIFKAFIGYTYNAHLLDDVIDRVENLGDRFNGVYNLD